MKKTALFAALVVATLGQAFAQDAYPARPIQMIVPFGPGGTTDLMARALQMEFEKALGGSIVIVNKAGAGGALGMGEAARAKPDGYGLALATLGTIALQTALKKQSYSVDSFDYICMSYDVPVMLMVPQNSPFKTMQDYLDYAKKNPGALPWGSSGVGTSIQLSMASLLKKAGVTALHVPYKSTGDMVQAMLGGQVMAFTETPAIAAQYNLRPLAVLASKRLDAHPNVATAKELGVEAYGSVGGGVVAPKGLPDAIRTKLEGACQKALQSPAYVQTANRLNNPPVYLDGKAFAHYTAEIFKTNTGLVKELGIE